MVYLPTRNFGDRRGISGELEVERPRRDVQCIDSAQDLLLFHRYVLDGTLSYDESGLGTFHMHASSSGKVHRAYYMEMGTPDILAETPVVSSAEIL